MLSHLETKILMKIKLTLLFLAVLVLGLKAQQESNTPTVYASFHSYASSGKELPFWLRANQNGTFPVGNNTTQLLRTGLYRAMDQTSSELWNFFYGTELVVGYAGESYFQPNQYWAGARYKWIVIKAGAEADPIRFGGLSTSNGNMDASDNARPVPQISLSTNGYQSFKFLPGWLSLKGFYAEGMLWDNGYVKNAHLHHKNVYFRVALPKEWKISLGLEHYVFWGGTSPDYGQLPGWSQYFRYILGMKGGEGAANNDKKNGAGNQLGIYNLEVQKKLPNGMLTLYLNHPYEDRSGLELANIQDGLLGIHYGKNNKRQFISELVYEWMYTMNQSGTYNMIPAPEDPTLFIGRGNDKYFNHFVYSSGFTHYAQMMGTPLFVPKLDANGVSKGFESSRMWMHHLGLKGWLGNGFFWKTMLTYSRNFGEYQNPYPEPLSEFSFLGEIKYQLPRLPLQLGGGFAGDIGERFEKRVGGYVGVKWGIK